MILGGGLAEACSKAATSERSDPQSIEQCDLALQNEILNSRDRAGTYVNRGVMRLRREEFELARADFDVAIGLAPGVGEAYVNRGAALVGERHFKAGLDDINYALRLGVKEPEKAYFNRALAYEGLDDEKSALSRFPASADIEARLGFAGARIAALYGVQTGNAGAEQQPTDTRRPFNLRDLTRTRKRVGSAVILRGVLLEGLRGR